MRTSKKSKQLDEPTRSQDSIEAVSASADPVCNVYELCSGLSGSRRLLESKKNVGEKVGRSRRMSYNHELVQVVEVVEYQSA